MRLLTGTDNGLVKLVDLDELKVVETWGSLQAGNEVDQLQWLSKDDETEFLVSFQTGTVQSWSTLSGSLRADAGKYSSRVRGLVPIVTPMAKRVVTATESGLIEVRPLKYIDEPKVEGAQEVTPAPILTTGKNINRMKINPHNASVIGFAGKDHNLTTFDFERKRKVWGSVAVQPDGYGVTPPNNAKDFSFFLDNPHCLVVANVNRRIRIYDTRTGKKATVDVAARTTNAGDNVMFTTCAISPFMPNCVIIGNAVGDTSSYDLRTGLPFRSFLVATGSIRGISPHPDPTQNFMTTCSLDRHIRLYKLAPGQLEAMKFKHLYDPKIYCKQRLTCVLMSRDLPKLKPKEEIVTKNERIVQKIFDKMENLNQDGEALSDEEDVKVKIEDDDDLGDYVGPREPMPQNSDDPFVVKDEDDDEETQTTTHSSSHDGEDDDDDEDEDEDDIPENMSEDQISRMMAQKRRAKRQQQRLETPSRSTSSGKQNNKRKNGGNKNSSSKKSKK